MIDFASPAVLFFLGLVPAVWFLHGAASRKLSVYRLPLFSSRTVGNELSGFKRMYYRIPSLLTWVALVLLIIALADPQGAVQTEEKQEKGNRFSLAFDASLSMKWDWGGSNKMSAAKEAAKDLVEANPTDPFAVLPFRAGPQFQEGIPFMTDRRIIFNTIDAIEPRSETAVGTGILGAIWYVLADIHAVHGLKEKGVYLPDFSELLDALKGSEREREQIIETINRDFPSRGGSMVIAVTDAKSNTGFSMKEALKFAGSVGVAVYIVGIDASLDVDWRNVLDETQGGFFEADSRDAVKEMYREIDSIKPVVVQTVTITEKKSFRPVLAWIIFSMLVVAFAFRYIFAVEIK